MKNSINEYKYPLKTYKQQIAKYVFDSKEFKVIDIRVKKAFMNWIESDFHFNEQVLLSETIKKVYKNLIHDIRRVKTDLKFNDIIAGRILEKNMITTINEFKLHLESIGDISNEEINNKKLITEFEEYLNNNFKKEKNTTADWSGIDAWKLVGNTYDGYFIIKGENANPYTLSYDLCRRYDDENDDVQHEIILNIENEKDIQKFKELASVYTQKNISERSDFDAVANIGKITKEITIELDLKHTMHSMERQGRSGEYVKNSDIKTTVDKATEQIIDLLITNKLNIGDAVWIYDTTNDLNVVGGLNSNRNSDVITFKLITCMFHKEFYNKHKTYKVTV